MSEVMPFAWDIIKWVVMVVGTIFGAWTAVQKSVLQSQINYASQQNEIKQIIERMRQLEQIVETSEKNRNSEYRETSERLARVETKMDSLPRLEAKIDMLVSSTKS